MLDKAADFLTADNARKVKSIMSLVEPAVIFAGCVIALIIFALISVTMSLNAALYEMTTMCSSKEKIFDQKTQSGFTLLNYLSFLS